MKIGKYIVGINARFMWTNVRDAIRALLAMVYESHDFPDGSRMVTIGPLTFAWTP